ncbi:DUF4363 family protein [Alkalicoccobacillus porphyridii]|uniref:DUF4363 family protein n=1 Tax=Alkalicoccobacillus porphyridii TaxID=2597270 RepID=A0A553ZWS7_9BACI|nr:DUF4363 family protein [Alkalicoccobacillus porphyridii]
MIINKRKEMMDRIKIKISSGMILSSFHAFYYGIFLYYWAIICIIFILVLGGHILQRYIVLNILLLLFLSGCGDVVGSNLFFNQMDQLEEALDRSDWDQIERHAYKFNEIYKTNKWKLQLIGDEGEYEGLNESIQKMIAGVKEEDITNVRLELASARSLIADIYSL